MVVHDKNLTHGCHTSVVSLIFLHKNLSDWPILLLLVDFFLSVCLSVCCAQIYDSNESDRKRLNRRLSCTSRHAATVDASSPVATEILLFEETETQAVFSPDARGYWNLEFLAWFFTRVHGNV